MADGLDGGGGRILVVEEAELSRNLLVASLLSGGFDVMAAATPAEALRHVEEGGLRPDLLVVQVEGKGVPVAGLLGHGASGPVLAALLRARLPGLAVLFLSSQAEPVLDQEWTLDPLARVLCRPFQLQDVLREAGALAQAVAREA